MCTTFKVGNMSYISTVETEFPDLNIVPVVQTDFQVPYAPLVPIETPGFLLFGDIWELKDGDSAILCCLL